MSNAIASHPQLQKEKGEGTDTYLGRGTLFLFHIQGCRLLPLDLWLIFKSPPTAQHVMNGDMRTLKSMGMSMGDGGGATGTKSGVMGRRRARARRRRPPRGPPLSAFAHARATPCREHAAAAAAVAVLG